MNQLQTVLDALTLLGSYANLPRDASSEEAKAIAIVRGMMQAEPVAWRFIDDEDGGHTSFKTTPPTDAQAAYLAKWNRPAWEPLFTAPVAPQAVPAVCEWTQDTDFESGDAYHSSCGELWSFIDGGPKENRVSYCHNCGKPVKLASAPKGTV